MQPHDTAGASPGLCGSRGAVDALRLVFWETTAGCNLECMHCRRLEVSRELMQSDLTTEEGLGLIDRIAAVGRPVLVFSGGEPLLRPDIFELAGHARAAGLPIALATNGTLIDAGLARRIAATGFDRVSISLDGADEETHDRFRGLPGSFAQSMAGLRHLRAVGVPTQINCTIARHNKDQITALLQLAEREGAAAVHYFLLVPVGCGARIADGQMLDMHEVEERLRLIDELAQATTLQIKPTCAPHYYRIIRQQGRQRGGSRRSSADAAHSVPPGQPGDGGGAAPLHSLTKGCLAGTAVCFVSHEGEVFPCGYLPVSAGNVRRQDFGSIWREAELFRELRDPHRLTGKCGACEFKFVCAGCRARAFYQFGDHLAEEPYCAYEPPTTRQRSSSPGVPPASGPQP